MRWFLILLAALFGAIVIGGKLLIDYAKTGKLLPGTLGFDR